MVQTSETSVIIVCGILLTCMTFIFAFAWGKMVLRRHKEFEDFKNGVKPDCISAFRHYFLTKLEVARIVVLKSNMMPKTRTSKMSELRAIEKKFPDLQQLLATNKPLVLESFLTDYEIHLLKIAD